MTYTAIFEKTDTGYSAWAPDLPGCVSCGKTLEEAKTMMQEAINGHLSVMHEFGEVIPPPTTVAAEVEVLAETLAEIAGPLAA